MKMPSDIHTIGPVKNSYMPDSFIDLITANYLTAKYGKILTPKTLL
jgi:hypothetical protein